MIGFGGAIGGAVFGLIAGYLLGHGVSYGVLFALVGSFHLVGFAALALFGGQIRPLGVTELREIEIQA
jgi:ACS family hexuronate transporter-like MFS transporter